jgi:hypothetical protein
MQDGEGGNFISDGASVDGMMRIEKAKAPWAGNHVGALAGQSMSCDTYDTCARAQCQVVLHPHILHPRALARLAQCRLAWALCYWTLII